MNSENKSIRAKVVEKIHARYYSIKFNMTPMIDIVFLLLVFFLSTARFRPLEAKLPMQIPAPQGGEFGALTLVEPLLITLSSEGAALRISTNGQQYLYTDVNAASLVSFGNELTEIYQTKRRRTEDPIELDCNPNLSWEHLTKFYNLMYGMGITNITFVMD